MTLRSAAPALLIAICSCSAPVALPAAEPSTVVITRQHADVEEIPEGDDTIPLVVVRAWPAGASVDGDLSEWAGAPSLDLGAAGVDGSARVWIAPSADGLFVAGEVRDAEVLPSDRVELALGFPAAEPPPLGFANQWGMEEVTSPDWCNDSERTVGQDEERERQGCRRWFEENTARRREIAGLFQSHYAITQGGAARRDAGGAPGSPFKSVTLRFAGGYRFETLIPTAALPATSEAPVFTLRAVVDVIDADAKGERVVSSSPAARADKVETWPEAILKEPIHFGRAPLLLERVLDRARESLEQQRAFYYLPADAAVVHFLMNPVRGYQSMPEEPSPAVVDVDLTDQKPIGALGDVTVVDMPMHPGFGFTPLRGLASFRAGELVDISEPSDYDPSKAVARPPGLHVLRTYNGMMNSLGTGMCGGCLRVDFEMVEMDASGHFQEAIQFDGVGGAEVQKVEPIAMSAQGGFGVRSNMEDLDSGKKEGSEITYRWDMKKSEYVRTDKAVPLLP